MNRLAHEVVAAEGKRQVADAAADLHAGTRRLDDSRGLDEVDRVLVVFLETGGDRQDVGVEDDVGRGEAGPLRQQPVGALTDGHLPFDRVRLTLLVERHHDDARAVPPDDRRFLQEILLAFLQADGVDDALALHALQTGEDDGPFRAVDHDRNAGDLGLGRDVVHEIGHDALGVEHALVHVDVDQIRAAAYLVERDGGPLCIVARPDQAREPHRPGHVGPLADHL